MSHRLLIAGALFAIMLPSAARAQAALPMGTPAPGRVEAGGHADFTFEASAAGVLTVAVQGAGDLALAVQDVDGQVVPDGSADRDLGGELGKEYLSVILTEPGSYVVRVRHLGGAPMFDISASWMIFPAFERPSDPDGRPSQATVLAIGEDHEDALDSRAGDEHDWFLMTAGEGGVLTVVLRPVNSQADLILEVYTDDLSSPAARSDQDLEGDAANEATTLTVTAGADVHVKVVGFGSSTQARYRLSSSLLP